MLVGKSMKLREKKEFYLLENPKSQEWTHLYKVLIRRKRCDPHSGPWSSPLLDERSLFSCGCPGWHAPAFPSLAVGPRGGPTQVQVGHTRVPTSQPEPWESAQQKGLYFRLCWWIFCSQSSSILWLDYCTHLWLAELCWESYFKYPQLRMEPSDTHFRGT